MQPVLFFGLNTAKRATFKSDLHHLCSKMSVKVWRNKGYSGPAEVIPQFGVQPDMFKVVDRKDTGRAFVIGSAARRLVPEKGIDLLLKAVSDIQGIWRLHIAGDGPQRSRLERLAREYGIEERVIFDGTVPSGDMPAYLAQLDVLVVPSRTMPNWKEPDCTTWKMWISGSIHIGVSSGPPSRGTAAYISPLMGPGRTSKPLSSRTQCLCSATRVADFRNP